MSGGQRGRVERRRGVVGAATEFGDVFVDLRAADVEQRRAETVLSGGKQVAGACRTDVGRAADVQGKAVSGTRRVASLS